MNAPNKFGSQSEFMSSATSKPPQPARGKSNSSTKPSKPPKTKSTTPAGLATAKSQAVSRRKTSTSQDAALGTKSADLDREQELLQVQSLLAQIWHRNKNQHRGQKWWKWVSVLKRCVRDLVLLGAAGEQGESGSRVKMKKNEEQGLSEAARARKRMERDRTRREKRQQVEEWVREVVLGRCWLAFSTLVADRQFSTLGVVLLAILAQAGKVVGLPEPALPAEPQVTPGQQGSTVLAMSLAQTGVDTGEVIERVFDGRQVEDPGLVVSREQRTESMLRKERDGKAGDEASMGSPLDEKELVSVVDEGVTESLPAGVGNGDLEKGEQSTNEAVARRGVADTAPAMAERKKKRRKKGNAIDDLFAGLS